MIVYADTSALAKLCIECIEAVLLPEVDMSFYVYILRCSDGSYYVGHTDSLEQRLDAHERGEVPGYTSVRRPLELVWGDSFASRQEALERERQIKGWSRAKKEALVRGDWSELQRLARSRGAGASSPGPEGEGS